MISKSHRRHAYRPTLYSSGCNQLHPLTGTPLHLAKVKAHYTRGPCTGARRPARGVARRWGSRRFSWTDCPRWRSHDPWSAV